MSCASQLAKKYGGYWKEHPYYTISKWQGGVSERHTRLGYWEWVENQIGAYGDRTEEVEKLLTDAPKPDRNIVEEIWKDWADHYVLEDRRKYSVAEIWLGNPELTEDQVLELHDRLCMRK